MSHLTHSAEEVFRFVSIRAPGAVPHNSIPLEIADDSKVAEWLADTPVSSVAEQLAALEQQVADTTARLLSADLASEVWKFTLQAIASGEAQPAQLLRARELLAQALALPEGTLPALKLPLVFEQHLRERHSLVAQQAVATFGHDTSEREQLEQRLRLLQDLEARLVAALVVTGPFDPVVATTIPIDTPVPQEQAPRALHIHPAADLDALFAQANPVLAQSLADALGVKASAGRYQVLDLLRREIAEIMLELARLDAAAPPAQQAAYAIRPAGVADLRVVRATLLGHDRGELAQIENVAAGTTRESHVSLIQRVDETAYASADQGAEATREAQANERYEMGGYAFTAIREYNDRNSSVNEAATYGDVTRNTSTFMSEGRSREQAAAQDTRRSRDIINRAVALARANVSQSRWRSASAELQPSVHQKQKASCDNMVAQYRFVDKVYEAQVYSYGARAVYEATVPLPASPLGLAPQAPVLQAADITDATWLMLAYRYGVTLPAPPLAAIVDLAQSSFPSGQGGLVASAGAFDAQQIQARGYQPALGAVSIVWFGVSSQGGVVASIGTAIFSTAPLPATPIGAQRIIDGGLEVSFSAAGYGAVEQFTVNFALLSVRTDAAVQTWQQACLQIIQADYERKLAAHRAALQARLEAGLLVDDMRAIERASLKQAVIAQMRVQAGVADEPITAREARFLELAFEWTEMTYSFDAPTIESLLQPPYGDGVFTAFLRARSATVLLTVRPGYEDAVALYLTTGIVEEIGLVTADEHVARLNRDSVLSNAETESEVPVGEPFCFRLPTSMLIIEDGTRGELQLADCSTPAE